MENQKENIPELGQGIITLDDINEISDLYVSQLNGQYISNAQLINTLKSYGSLKLYKAELYLDDSLGKVAFCFDKLILEDSKIYIRSNNISIICNEYVQKNSTIYSFEDSNINANNGLDGVSNGKDGEDAKDGLESGNAYVFVSSSITSVQGGIRYYLHGQNGGFGGNGGKGIKGENGSSGTNCRNGDLPGDCRRGSGNGKNGKTGKQGGDAGNGGNGGNGGNLEFKIITNSPYSSFFNFSGGSGNGNGAGVPGQGGDGGTGGKAGRSNCSRCDRPRGLRAGYDGAKGVRGNYGIKGENGQSSNLLRSSYIIDELNAFLTSWRGIKLEKLTEIVQIEK
jgi:hypothetical protein